MAKVNFSQALADEYQRLFDACQVRAEKAADVETVVSRIVANSGRYKAVAEPLGIPWYFIGVIHAMEASLSFSTHLHNGDPLAARTVHVPVGRPKAGTPPFSWEESAMDALRYDGVNRWHDWSIGGMLYKIEGYNGWGYRLYHQHVLSPYLWSGSNHYCSGKYTADGRWSDTAVSMQIGAAVLLRRMAEKGVLAVGFEKPPVSAERPVLHYAPAAVSEHARSLQVFLNRFPGIFLREDGIAGEKTSDAFQKITGRYLLGDPRETPEAVD